MCPYALIVLAVVIFCLFFTVYAIKGDEGNGEDTKIRKSE